MGMFRRRGGGGAGSTGGTAEGDHDGMGNSSRENLSFGHGSNASIDPELQGQAQEVMKDNLELMKDIVMKIREDPEFAKGIYKNCPRLQHLLEQYPDLRPIFEDPKLVRLNFEQVYRDAGGVLPEDEEKKKKSWLIWFVNSPIFKILKLLLFVKRLVACIMGGGFTMITGCLVGCCCEDALEEAGEVDVEEQPVDPNREALNRAADHMEDPEVQEQMQRLLDDPENLQEAIENDPELRALRDSNPLCEELMSDPETMRVLTDPDNLRALGEAPSLIEADFVDPDSFVPEADLETGGLEGEYDAFNGGAEVGQEFAVEAELEVEGVEDVPEDFVEDEDGWWEDAEVEAAETEAPQGDNATAGEAARGRAQSRVEENAEEQALAAAEGGEGATTGSRFGGIMASIGVMATDLIAAQIVGSVFGDDLLGMTELMGGGGDEPDIDVAAVENLDAAVDSTAQTVTEIEEVAQVAVDTVEDVDEQTSRAQQVAEGAVDAADSAQVALEEEADRRATMAVGIGVGVAAAGGLAAGGGYMAARAHGARAREGNTDRGQILEEEEFVDEESEPGEKLEAPRKSRFGFAAIRNLGSALATAAAEHVTSSMLGDDFGEQVVDNADKLKKKKDGDEEDENQGSGRLGDSGRMGGSSRLGFSSTRLGESNNSLR